MGDRDAAKVYILEVAKRIFDTEGCKGDYRKQWEKVTLYRPRFLSESDFSGRSVQRSEIFTTNDDNKAILKILKLVYSLLQTSSYTTLTIEQDCIKIGASQAGRGDFSVIVRLIDYQNNLQIRVNTISSRP